MFPADDARRHIERLERHHGVEVRIVKHLWDSEASPGARIVWIPDPTSPLRYLVSLHEFGHVLDKVSAKVMHKSKPECEAAAWRWAIQHARPELLDYMTPRMWTIVGKAWLSNVTSRAPRMR